MQYFHVIATLIAILLTPVSALASKGKTAMRDELLQLSADFASQTLRDTKGASQLSRMVAARDIPDSTIYGTLNLFTAKAVEAKNQGAAFEYFRALSSRMDKEKSQGKEARTFHIRTLLKLGALADESGMRNVSMDFYMKALRLAKETKDDEAIAGINNNIGVSHCRIGDFAAGRRHFDISRHINDSLGLRKGLFLNFNNIAETYLHEGNLQEALDWQLKALRVIDQEKEPDDYFYLYSCIGQIYNKMGKPDLAAPYLQTALSHQTATAPDGYYTFETRLTLTDLYQSTGQTDSMAIQIKDAARIAEAMANPALQLRVLEKETELFELRGDFQTALATMRRAAMLKDSISNADNASRMSGMQAIHEIEMKEEAARSPLDRMSPVQIFIAMVSVVAVLAFILVWIIHLKHRNDKAVGKQLEAERNLRELKEKILTEQEAAHRQTRLDLDEEHRKLTTYTLDRIRSSQHVAEISNDIRALITLPPSKEKDLTARLREILGKVLRLETDGNWDEFQHYFEKVHPDFYSSLSSAHPDLTIKDRRLCAMLSLGLSTKDIASITFREVRSVESSRNRLRKKLNLPQEENLVEYLGKFTLMQ